MDARLLLRESIPLSETAFVEMIAWHVPRPVVGSDHLFKYSLALIADEVCVLRYDNEAGKGDHKHIGKRQSAYYFVDLDQVQIDFWKDVEEWMRTRGGL